MTSKLLEPTFRIGLLNTTFRVTNESANQVILEHIRDIIDRQYPHVVSFIKPPEFMSHYSVQNQAALTESQLELLEAHANELARYDLIIFSTPTYGGSVPAIFKTWVEWMSRPDLFASLGRENPLLQVTKKAAVITASAFNTSTKGMHDLNKCLGELKYRSNAHFMSFPHVLTEQGATYYRTMLPLWLKQVLDIL